MSFIVKEYIKICNIYTPMSRSFSIWKNQTLSRLFNFTFNNNKDGTHNSRRTPQLEIFTDGVAESTKSSNNALLYWNSFMFGYFLSFIWYIHKIYKCVEHFCSSGIIQMIKIFFDHWTEHNHLIKRISESIVLYAIRMNRDSQNFAEELYNEAFRWVLLQVPSNVALNMGYWLT